MSLHRLAYLVLLNQRKLLVSNTGSKPCTAAGLRFTACRNDGKTPKWTSWARKESQRAKPGRVVVQSAVILDTVCF